MIANDFVDDATRERLVHPPTGILDLSKEPDKLLEIEVFMSVSQRDKYEAVREAIKKRSPEIEMPSYDVTKSTIEELTGKSHICTLGVY